jgi:hypothetical protein
MINRLPVEFPWFGLLRDEGFPEFVGGLDGFYGEVLQRNQQPRYYDLCFRYN